MSMLNTVELLMKDMLQIKEICVFNIFFNLYSLCPCLYTVELLMKDTPNKGHLSIKDKTTPPNSYYTCTL